MAYPLLCQSKYFSFEEIPFRRPSASLIGAKPLSKLMMTSYQSHTMEHNSMKNVLKLSVSSDEIALEVIVCNFAAILVRRPYSKQPYN